ncbi:MAG: type II secretion system protein GspD [Armatimonadetes bacterium]|nr:type II secretion system protein GspD [Armatimonadota bacterium]
MPALTLALLAFSSAVGGFAQEAEGAKDAPKEAKTGETEEKKTDGSSLDIQVTDGGVRLFAVNADAHALFTQLAEKTNLQLIVDDSVKRKITINLVDKQPREAIDYIVAAYGFSFAEVEGILIVSEGIPKNPSSYLLSEIDSITTKYVQAPQAKSLLPVFLQDHVKINAGQNAVVLSAPRSVLNKFAEDIRKFDQPAAQITLDVLVVELTDTSLDTFALDAGFVHAGHGLSANTLLGTLLFRSVTNLPADFYVNLDALVSAGRARVRANPHISTVSGQPAGIFIGQQRYLSTPVTMGDQDSYMTKNSIDAGVRLDMTPLTGGQGEIILQIDEEISTLGAPDPNTGLPDKSTRSARTVVRANDGETIIIGGLQQEETRSVRSRIPVLSSLPIVGGLFKSKRIDKTKTDLAVFVTPRILTPTGHRPPEEERALMDRFDIAPPAPPQETKP